MSHEVVALIIKRLLALQIEQGVLLDVIPVRSRERIEATLREKGVVQNDALPVTH